MRKFRNRLSLLIALPAFPLVMIGILIRGESDWWEPMVVWWREFLEGR